MTPTSAPLAEINATAIRLLCREMGAVNTARFLNQFTTGTGDYTAERDSLLGEPTVDKLIAEMQRRRRRPSKSKKSMRKRSGGTH